MAIKRDTLIEDAADELDLSIETLRRDVKRGAPYSRDGRRIMFNVPELLRWREAHNLTGRRGRPAEVLSPDLAMARLRKENALASKYELQVAREKRELLPAPEVKKWIGEHIGEIRTRLLSLGDELTPSLEGRDAPERASIINERVREILTDLATKAEVLGDESTNVPQPASVAGREEPPAP
jgi:hypothetical protein